MSLRKKTRKFGFKKFIFVFLLVSLFFLLFKLQTKFWNGQDKLSLVVPEGDDVQVVVFDPKGASITKILIPGDTRVVVSRGLGTWRLKSVWQLGINERKTGILLAETVTKNFDFPVFLWTDEGGYKTNLKLGDRLNLALFSLRVKNTERVEIDLAKTSFLRKGNLKDGEGFLVAGKIPDSLAAIFSDREISASNFNVLLRDRTGRHGVAEKVGEIVEVLGPKVAAIVKESKEGSDCKVLGKNESVALKIARIFGCKNEGGLSGNFDLEIDLGSLFSDRF